MEPARREHPMDERRELRLENAAAPALWKRISWQSVFAGTVVALIAQVWLGLVGVAIGAATINPATEAQPFAGLGVFGIIWALLTGIVALFIGGWIAARLSNVPRKSDGVLHGVVTWAVANVVVFYLMTTTIAGLFGTLANVASGSLEISPTAIMQSQEQIAQQGDQVTPEVTQPQQIGQETATAVASASGWLAAAMFLGLCSAAFGGAIGRPKEVVQLSRL